MNHFQRDEYGKRNYSVAVRENVLERSDAAGAIALDGIGFGEWMRREISAAWAACGMFEFVALGYLGFSAGLIALFAENLVHPFRLIGTQAFIAALILVLCGIAARRGTD